MAARKKIIIENVSTNANKAIYVGDSAVTTSSGVRLSAGSSIELEVGPSVSVYAIGAVAACDVRVLEIA